MFVPTLHRVPAAIDVETDGGTSSTLVPIAHCRETDRVVSVECMLSYTENPFRRPSCRWFHEFSFSISCAALNEDELPFSTQERDIARAYIPSSIRSLIMPIVLQSCTSLMTHVRPQTLYRVTKMRRPTPSALRKHDLLTARLRELDYAIIETGTDPFARTYWVMARR